MRLFGGIDGQNFYLMHNNDRPHIARVKLVGQRGITGPKSNEERKWEMLPEGALLP